MSGIQVSTGELPDLLIGHSGYVGTTVQRQHRFSSMVRSVDAQAIEGKSFDTVFCAAAPAQKWIANREPSVDRKNIDLLISRLQTIRCRTFILVSTVDVFSIPVGVDETSKIDETELHSYGLHRRLLERFVEGQFQNHLIVRLPGLVGAGLRKNVVFDFLNDNNLHAIDARAIYQFYPMANLWNDIQIALKAGLRLVHLTAEPLSVSAVAAFGFSREFESTLGATPARYDMQTIHAKVFGRLGRYQYDREQSIEAIRAYAQTEPRTLPRFEGTKP